MNQANTIAHLLEALNDCKIAEGNRDFVTWEIAASNVRRLRTDLIEMGGDAAGIYALCNAGHA